MINGLRPFNCLKLKASDIAKNTVTHEANTPTKVEFINMRQFQK